jgi:hypothetical protein
MGRMVIAARAHAPPIPGPVLATKRRPRERRLPKLFEDGDPMSYWVGSVD